jgi:uridine phosphorylase
MQEAKKMMHIAVSPGDVGKYVFLPGSVERAALIAQHFDNPVKLAHHREHLTYAGELDGERVAVTSTGIGGPSASIAVEELFQCGADTMMRIGSCASTSPRSKKGDVIIPRGAIRMEGTGTHYLPLEFPAVPDYEMFRALESAAKESGYPYNDGITITKDSFYTEVSPQTKPVYPELKWKWDAYVKGGATNTSMECSLLFLVGASLGIRMSSVMICATNDEDYSNDATDYPDKWEERAIEVGILAMRKIIQSDRRKTARNKNV